MKKLINSPEHVVNEALHGMAAAHADLIKVHYDPNFIYRADAPVKNKVAVISGGGSGHEPMHGGFVGRGMLDAACPGAVFTSPTPDQMLEATKQVDGGKGVLHIVKNYTGDVMNFELAADMARAENLKVESVIIDEGFGSLEGVIAQSRSAELLMGAFEKQSGAATDRRGERSDVRAAEPAKIGPPQPPPGKRFLLRHHAAINR